MNITKSDWCGAGYHCDDDDIAEDCTLKATISAIGLDDLNFYTFDQLRDKAWAAGKGPLAAWLVGTAGWTAKNASKFTKLGSGLLLGYGLYTSGKSFVTTFGNCINTERGGQNYGWF
jgi:hypothetical protein